MVNIDQIISKCHRSPASGLHEQAHNKWGIVLKRQAIILFNNQNEVHLNEGDYIEILALQTHRVSWTDPQIEMLWLAVHY